MTVHELTLASLKDNLEGGRVGAAFELELRRCIHDCTDRPGDTKERKVALNIKMKPVLGDGGFCDEVLAVVEVTSTVPKRRTKPISFAVRKTSGGETLVFNDLAEAEG